MRTSREISLKEAREIALRVLVDTEERIEEFLHFDWDPPTATTKILLNEAVKYQHSPLQGGLAAWACQLVEDVAGAGD